MLFGNFTFRGGNIAHRHLYESSRGWMEEQHSFSLWSASGGSNQSTTNQNKRVAQSNVTRPNNSHVVAGCVFSISYKGEKAEFILGKVATDSLCRTSAKKTASVPPEFLCILPLLYCRTYCLCLKVAKWNEEKSQRPSAQTSLNFTPEISLHLWEWESDSVLYWLMVISWWCHKEQRTCICRCSGCTGGSGSRPQHFITSPMLIINQLEEQFLYLQPPRQISTSWCEMSRSLSVLQHKCTVRTDKLERCFVLVLLGSIQTLCWISVWRTASDKCFGSRFEPFKNEGLDGSSFADWMFRLRRSLCFHSLRVLNSGW